MASTSVGPDLEKVSSSPNETSSPVPEETEEKRQLTGPRVLKIKLEVIAGVLRT